MMHTNYPFFQALVRRLAPGLFALLLACAPARAATIATENLEILHPAAAFGTAPSSGGRTPVAVFATEAGLYELDSSTKSIRAWARTEAGPEVRSEARFKGRDKDGNGAIFQNPVSLSKLPGENVIAVLDAATAVADPKIQYYTFEEETDAAGVLTNVSFTLTGSVSNPFYTYGTALALLADGRTAVVFHNGNVSGVTADIPVLEVLSSCLSGVPARESVGYPRYFTQAETNYTNIVVHSPGPGQTQDLEDLLTWSEPVPMTRLDATYFAKPVAALAADPEDASALYVSYPDIHVACRIPLPEDAEFVELLSIIPSESTLGEYIFYPLAYEQARAMRRALLQTMEDHGVSTNILRVVVPVAETNAVFPEIQAFADYLAGYGYTALTTESTPLLHPTATFGVAGAAGAVSRTLSAPAGLSVWRPSAGADPFLAVADRSNNRVVLFDQGGYPFSFGGPGSVVRTQLKNPEDVFAVSGEDLFLVADKGNKRLQLFELYPGEDAADLLFPDESVSIVFTTNTLGIVSPPPVVPESDTYSYTATISVVPGVTNRTYSITGYPADGSVTGDATVTVPPDAASATFAYRAPHGGLGGTPVELTVAGGSNEPVLSFLVTNVPPVVTLCRRNSDIIVAGVPAEFEAQATDVLADRPDLVYVWTSEGFDGAVTGRVANLVFDGRTRLVYDETGTNLLSAAYSPFEVFCTVYDGDGGATEAVCRIDKANAIGETTSDMDVTEIHARFTDAFAFGFAAEVTYEGSPVNLTIQSAPALDGPWSPFLSLPFLDLWNTLSLSRSYAEVWTNEFPNAETGGTNRVETAYTNQIFALEDEGWSYIDRFSWKPLDAASETNLPPAQFWRVVLGDGEN